MRRTESGRKAAKIILMLCCILPGIAPGWGQEISPHPPVASTMVPPEGVSSDGTVTVPLPIDIRSADRLALLISVGPLPRGAQITISSDDGAVLGVVSPFGPQASAAGAVYSIPLPQAVAGRARRSGGVSLRLRLYAPGRPSAVPTAVQVSGVRLVRLPTSTR